MDSFHIKHYAPDAEVIESGPMKVADLSPKWLAVCTDLIASHGPTFETSLGGTLSDYTIKCTAGFCVFSVSEQIVLAGALLPPGAEAQNNALMATLSRSVGAGFSAGAARPLFLIVDYMNEEVLEEDQDAMFQLACHFAAAYFQWCANAAPK